MSNSALSELNSKPTGNRAPEAGNAYRLQRVVQLALLTAVVCWCGTWHKHPAAADRRHAVAPAGDLQLKIDPNRAPWWQLAHLRGIGRVRAKRIVSYRQIACQQPAFLSPERLDTGLLRPELVGPQAPLAEQPLAEQQVPQLPALSPSAQLHDLPRVGRQPADGPLPAPPL